MGWRFLRFIIPLLLTLGSNDSGDWVSSAPVGVSAVTATSYTFSGLDAHDGMAYQVGTTYYIVGTRYGCGFTWGQPNTPWCGFGVFTSNDKVTWTFQRLLFDPASLNSWKNESWQTTCGLTGAGCFNPRMAERPDGVWVLWFNAPGDNARWGANAYYIMGCNGPTGPCGDGAGPPYGSTHKPDLYICSGNGDFSLTNVAGFAYIVCTMNDQTLRLERLDQWWANGVNIGLSNLGGVTHAEAPGVIGDGTSLYVTYSSPECGYCSGTGTGQLVATSMLGPWQIQAPISARSCSGQPRSTAYLDGLPYLWIDQWNGQAPNQTTAAVHLEQLAIGGSQAFSGFSSLAPVGC